MSTAPMPDSFPGSSPSSGRPALAGAVPAGGGLRRRCRLLACALLCGLLAACSPGDPVEEIRAMQARGEYLQTLEPLRELLKERRDDPELHFLYGRALTLTGQQSMGAWSLRKAMEDPEWKMAAGTQLAWGAVSHANYRDAIDVTTELLQEQPDNVELLILRAQSFARDRMDPARALDDVERVLEIDPDNAAALEPKILALLTLERGEEAGEAIAELGRLIEEQEVGPGRAGWHCATSAIFANDDGKPELARERWEECTEKYPAHSNVVGKAVEFYEANEEYARALEIVERAHQEVPESRDYRLAYTDRLRFAGRNDEALAILREQTEHENPHLAAVGWLDLAHHLSVDGDLEAAADAESEAIAIFRSLELLTPEMLLQHADRLLLAGRVDEAEQIAREIEVEAHRELMLARVAQSRGELEEALEHFDAHFRLTPSNPWSRYYAAVAAEQLGDFDRAIEEYRYSVRINAGATDARVRAARLLQADGEPQQALTILRTLVDQYPLDLAGELLSLELWAQLGSAPGVAKGMGEMLENRPAQFVAAGMAAAEGVETRAGAEAAARWLVRWAERSGVDLRHPASAPAVARVIRWAGEAGDLSLARPLVEAGLEAHPESGIWHALRGQLLEAAGAPEEEARAAYRRALELQPGLAAARAALAELDVDEAPEEAAETLVQLADASPDNPRLRLEAAAALRAAGREEAAAERLEALVRDFPTDVDAVVELAELRLSRGESGPEVQALARRAVRFGAGERGERLLTKIEENRAV